MHQSLLLRQNTFGGNLINQRIDLFLCIRCNFVPTGYIQSIRLIAE